jgi:hypothetical protein
MTGGIGSCEPHPCPQDTQTANHDGDSRSRLSRPGGAHSFRNPIPAFFSPSLWCSTQARLEWDTKLQPLELPCSLYVHRASENCTPE